ncbi:hypothetical protein BVX93_00580, partial [bacterium B13(2017)]
MLKPLWEYIFKHKLGEVAFFCLKKSSSLYNHYFRFCHIPNTIKELTSYGLTYIKDPYKFKPDITFVADYNYHFVEGLGVIVNIGHGTISKGLYYLNNKRSKRENISDLICVPGTIHKRYLQQVMYKPIEVTGMPKLDKIFIYSKNKTKELLKLKLDPNKYTVLFAPTFNKELSILTFIQDKIRKYVPKDYNLIIKLHGAVDIELKNKIKKIAEISKNTYFAKQNDISVFFN